MYLRYSSSVVAPMNWISPLDNEGFSILEASTAPSAAPAPTIVCNSSIKTIQLPAPFISSSTFFKRSSNSPRYLVPATSDPISRVTSRLFRKVSGTSPVIICWASLVTIADLPTPGSPIKAGLFLVLRLRIWMIRSHSFSLPTI